MLLLVLRTPILQEIKKLGNKMQPKPRYSSILTASHVKHPMPSLFIASYVPSTEPPKPHHSLSKRQYDPMQSLVIIHQIRHPRLLSKNLH
jgi:hypothetical protein